MPHHHHQQQHPYMNYYPYMPRGSTGSVQPAYQSAHLDQNGAAWPQAMAAAAMAAAMVDPATLAAYMNGATNAPNGYLPANPADLAQYDQFSFGFTPAFGFGYNSSGSLDYHANTNTTAWTNSPSAIANSSNSSSASSSATNTTATSPPINDTNKSTTSTTNQTTNVPAKWVQMVQDPLSVQHMNELNTAYVAQQQLSPVDLYQHVTSVNNRHNYQQHNQRHMLNYHTNHHYNNTTTNGLFPPYYHGNTNQMIHSGTNHHHYNSNKHHNYNYQLNKIENGINSMNINTNTSDKEPKQVAELTTPIDNQQIDDSEQNLDLTKSDSKTWASIVSVNQQQSSRSSPSPTYNQQFEQNDKKIKQINKPIINQPQQEQQTNFDLFAFPPISVNSLNTKAEKIEPKTKVATATTAIASTTKKQQLYNSYQKQQQFNMSTTTTVQNNKVKTNGESATEPLKLNGTTTSSHYYKKHQPSQHTISSFMTNLDKSLFFNDKTDEQTTATTTSEQNVLDLTELKVYTNPNAYNPKELNTSPKAARFFVIKSYSEDDVHRSIKYNIWCSTEHGNRRLDSAYFKGDSQVPVYLFFSVNGSGHFCGMAEMMSRVDYNKKTDVWSQDKWRGCFQVKWIYVKDVPNSLLRNIKLENNDNKPVTNSRDTQEIPFEKGKQVLKVFHTYNHSSSILDDFDHYERKQEEDTFKSLNHNVNFNQIYNQIEYINNHQFMMDQQFVTMENNLIITNNSNKLVDTNVSNTNTELNANNESTSLVNSSSSSSTMTTSTTTATNTTVSSSATSSPMSASSSSSSASSVSSSDESKEIEINKKEQQQHQPQLVVT